MRKLALLLGLSGVLLTASPAWAQGFGNAGCGLGSMVFGADNTWWKQVLAATTNGLFANQTFAITSGTSNCTGAGLIKAEREQEAFAEVNFQDLKRDMASGGGEFLASFSNLLGCEESARPVLYQYTQAHFPSLVPTTQTTPAQMLSNLKQGMKSEPALAGACSDQRALARAQGKPVDVAQSAPVSATK